MLDSGFCVLQEIIELRKVGCFEAVVIKKGGNFQIILTER